MPGVARRLLRARYFHHSAGAVVIADGRCLTIKLADRDEWVFPKGHIEPGETAVEAAIREVQEETGLAIRILASVGTSRFSFGRRHEHRKRVDWFLAEPVGRELRLEPIFGDAAFVDEAEALALLTHQADREIAERAFDLARGLARGERAACAEPMITDASAQSSFNPVGWTDTGV